MSLRALIWDVDGTLAETEEDGHRPAFNQAFAEAGLPWRWDAATYRELLAVTGGKERMQHWWQRVDPSGAAAPDAPSRIAALHARKTTLYGERVASGRVHLRPGVARLLDEAHGAGVRLAIATTTAPPNVRVLLQATLGPQGMERFEVVGAGDVVPAKKPAPDIYQWVLDRLGLPARDALALEDSPAGVAAARGAGLGVVLTRGLYTPTGPVPGVLADLSDLGEPGQPAHRHAPQGGPWPADGVVRLAQLEAWHRTAGAA